MDVQEKIDDNRTQRPWQDKTDREAARSRQSQANREPTRAAKPRATPGCTHPPPYRTQRRRRI